MSLEDLARDYRTGFLRYLPRRSEAAMTAGYELGGAPPPVAPACSTSSRCTTESWARSCRGTGPDTTQVVEAACEYLSEVLSTFDMAHRVLHDPAPEPPVAG